MPHLPVPGSSAKRVYRYSMIFKNPVVSSHVVLPGSTSAVRSLAPPAVPGVSPFVPFIASEVEAIFPLLRTFLIDPAREDVAPGGICCGNTVDKG